MNKYRKQIDELGNEQKDGGVVETLKNVWEHKKSLIADMGQLKLVDGYNNWREKEAKQLSDLVQRRFR